MPFFTSTKKPSAVFAGIDDPFNFPTKKMKYTSRSSSRTSSPDSGYGSIDDDAQLSPKSSPPQHRRRLGKDSKGHWRTHSYEYQSEGNDGVAERTPILVQAETFEMPTKGEGAGVVRKPDNDHEFKPNPRRTFTLICNEEAQKGTKEKPKPAPKPKGKETWFERRVYGRALQRRERSEGVSDLQREMAPVLRRASPSPEDELVVAVVLKKKTSNKTANAQPSTPAGPQSSTVQRPSAGHRKESTLLHPSPPPSSPTYSPLPLSLRPASRGDFGIKTTIVGGAGNTGRQERPGRSRTRKPSTLLHPSPPPSAFYNNNNNNDTSNDNVHETLRSPRHRSPTPLRIPLSSANQPAPTPLRIYIRKQSVLHSCFSDDEDADADQDEGLDSGSDSDSGAGLDSTPDPVSLAAPSGAGSESVGEPCVCVASAGTDSDSDTDSDTHTHTDADADADIDISKVKSGERPAIADAAADADNWSVSSLESGAGKRDEVVLARTGLVARAQRIRLVGLGLGPGAKTE